MSQMCVDSAAAPLPGMGVMPGQVNMSQEGLDEQGGGMLTGHHGAAPPRPMGGGQVASQTMPGMVQFSQPLWCVDQ